MRRLLAFASLWVAGALLGFQLLPEPEASASSHPVAIRVLGEPVALEPDEGLRGQARELARRYLAQPITLRAGDRELDVRRSALGAAVDLEHLTTLLQQAADPDSTLRRLHAQLRADQPLDLPIPAELDTAQALPWVERLKDKVDRPAIDARVDPDAQEVEPAQTGLELDVFGTLEAIDQALADGLPVVAAEYVELQPQRTHAALEGLEMKAILGEFETSYSRHEKARDRTHNLKTAAAAIDGTVVQPGAVFDFNAVVGHRSEHNGFKEAPVIAEGQVVDDVGGGTCQIASTLHAAAFFAGLPIMTRHPHTRPSFYIKLGLDATVVNNKLNFRFRNDLPHPLVIGMNVREGRVRAELRGPERTRTVTLLRRIDETMPFEERIEEDEELPEGIRVLVQRGIPGFRVSHWRVVRYGDTGHARREKSVDTYPPTTQIWRVGVGPEAGEDFEPPEDDSHPEYVADEYFAATQGPGIDGFDTVREPGRTGLYGWTERENMGPPPDPPDSENSQDSEDSGDAENEEAQSDD